MNSFSWSELILFCIWKTQTCMYIRESMLSIRSYGSPRKSTEWMLVRSHPRNCLLLHGKECKHRLFCDSKGGTSEDSNWSRDNICGTATSTNHISPARKSGEELDELVQQGIVEKIDAPSLLVLLVVVVPKRNDIRLCVDMRKAKQAVISERYPISTVEEVLQEFNQSTVFSKLDIKLAYHQIDLDPRARHITTYGTWRIRGYIDTRD